MIFELLYIVLPTYALIIGLAIQNCPNRIFYWDDEQQNGIPFTSSRRNYWRDEESED